MGIMKNILIPLMLVTCSHVVSIACSCAGIPSIEQGLSSAAVVFVGVVKSTASPTPDISTTTLEGKRFWFDIHDDVRYTFDIQETIKGTLSQTVEIATKKDGAMCGVHFEIGTSYLVYAYQRKTGLRTNSCWRNRIMDFEAQGEVIELKR